jgi:hypothetical protein
MQANHRRRECRPAFGPFGHEQPGPGWAGLNGTVPQPTLEILGHCLGGGITMLRILLEALETNDFKVPGNSRSPSPRRNGSLFPDPHQGVDDVRPAEWGLAGQDFVENRPQAVNIHGRGRRAQSGSLLRSHVGGRAYHRPHQGQQGIRVDPTREAEIADPWLAVLIEQDVSRLQVAVENAALVGKMDGPGYADHQRGRHAWSSQEVAPGDADSQASAQNQLHAEVVLPLPFSHLVNGDDVRMIQMRRRLGFPPKPRNLRLVRQLACPNHLHRHFPI